MKQKPKPSSVSKEELELLRKIFGRFGERNLKEVEKDPEACRLSLLREIAKDVPRISATLYDTTQAATFTSSVNEARQILNAAKTEKELQHT